MIKKILLTVLAVIVVFIGSVVWIVKANDKENKDNAVSFDKGNSSKTALIVYQNGRSSFSKDVGENIAKGLSEDGYKVITNQPGDYLEKDLSKYDLVIFGSPIYAGQTSSQIKKYADSVKNYGKAQVICYCLGAGKDTDESVKFKDVFKTEVKGAFKVVKSKFDADKDLPIKEVRKIIK